MIESLITSKSRIKLLLKFFLNPNVKSYLRELATEFGESTNAIRVELNRLVAANLLISKRNGRNVIYCANVKHPLYPDIHSILNKTTGLDRIHEIISCVGNVDSAYILGDYAKGIDSGIIDVLFIGKFDQTTLFKMLSKVESVIARKIRPLLFSPEEFQASNKKFQAQEKFILWGEVVKS